MALFHEQVATWQKFLVNDNRLIVEVTLHCENALLDRRITFENRSLLHES
jgi:hypothetical protein